MEEASGPENYDLPIEGWCASQIFEALAFFFGRDELFRAGPICEIGVHHGKFLVGAHNVLHGARALGIDIFDQQERNVDGSGHGALDKFQAAVSAHALAPERIDSMRMDSLECGIRDLDEIASRYGRFKIFSVDGGHTPHHVLNDMRIAEELTAQDGIVLVDDFFGPHWPGVTEGLLEFFRAKAVRFAPFMFLTNKLFLTGLSCHERALAEAEAFAATLSDRFEFRPVSFFGFRSLAAVAR